MGLLDSIFGGGKSKSETTMEMVNNQMVTVTQNVVNSCAVTTNQEIVIDLSGNVGTIDASGTKLEQRTAVNVNCALNAQNKAKISNKLANTLQQIAESQGSLAPFGSTSAKASTTITNTVNTAVSALTANQVAASVQQKVGVNASNNQGVIVIKNLTVDQSAKAVAQSIVDAVNDTGITQAVANSVDQTAKAKGATLFGSIFGDLNITEIVMIFIMIIVLIVGGVVLYKLFSNVLGGYSIYLPFSDYMTAN